MIKRLLLAAALVLSTAHANAALVAGYSFNEGTGTVVADVSGNNNGGTLSGATWAAGHQGQALSFDGVNDMVTIPNSQSLQLSTGFTLEAWVFPRTQGSYRTVILKERASNACYTLYGSSNSAGVPWGEVSAGGSIYHADGGSPLPLNSWSHIATTYDGVNIKVFTNGVQVAQAPATGTIFSSTNPLRIGGNIVWPEWWDGLIDDVRIYDAALTAAQITTDMNTPVGPVGPDLTPPTLSGGAPTGTFPVNTGGTTLQVTTSENATCHYSTIPNTVYANSVAFQTTGGTAHSQPIVGLQNGTTSNYYVRCQDAAANANTSDYLITFSVAAPVTGYLAHQWEWDAVVGTDSNDDGIPDQGIPTGYRIYYTVVSCCSAGTCSWPTTQMIDIPVSTESCGLTHCNSATSCCGDFPAEPPGTLVFFTVTAYNSAGESSTEHGAVVPTPCP